MKLTHLNVKPETRKRIVWALIAVTAVFVLLGVVNLLDYVLHGAKYNPTPLETPQEKHDLTWGLVFLSIAYKVGIVALAISGVTYEVWRWIQVRRRKLQRRLAAMGDSMRGGGSH
jgi:hypothetical protein